MNSVRNFLFPACGSPLFAITVSPLLKFSPRIFSSRSAELRWSIKDMGYGDTEAIEGRCAPANGYSGVGINIGACEAEMCRSSPFWTGAEKYQTVFDQPLLHTMYVDKRLADVHAFKCRRGRSARLRARKTHSCWTFMKRGN